MGVLPEDWDYRKGYIDQTDVGEKYEQLVNDPNFYFSYIWELEKDILKKEIENFKKSNNKEDIKFLDFACGTGRTLEFVEKFNNDNLGVDHYKHMTDVAEKKLNNSKLLTADLTADNTLKNERFDFITCYRFFLRAQEDLRHDAMDIIHELLDDNGLFLYTIHASRRSLNLPTAFIVNSLMNHTQMVMSPKKGKQLAEEHGFEVIRVYGMGFFPRFIVSRMKIIKKLDMILNKIPLFQYFGHNLVYICKKKQEN